MRSRGSKDNKETVQIEYDSQAAFDWKKGGRLAFRCIQITNDYIYQILQDVCGIDVSIDNDSVLLPSFSKP